MIRALVAQGRRTLGLPGPVLAVSALNVTISTAWQATLPVVPLIALALTDSPVWVGVAAGATAILPIVLALPAGWVVNRLATRALQGVASLAMIAATGFILVADSIATLIVGQALIGLAITLSSVAAQAFLAMKTSPEARDDAFGRYAFMMAFGNVLGPALGGLVAGWTGPRGAIVVAMALGLATAPQILLVPTERLGFGAHGGGVARSTWSLLKAPAIAFTLVASFVVVFGYSLNFSFYVLYLHELDFSTEVVGLLLSVGGGAMLAVRPMLGWAAARVGRSRLLAAVCLAMGLGLGLIPVFGAILAGQVAAALLVGAAFGLSQPLTMTLVSHAARHESLGLAFAWRQACQRAAELVSPVLMGVVVAATRLEAAFLLAAVVLLLTGGVAVRLVGNGQGRGP